MNGIKTLSTAVALLASGSLLAEPIDETRPLPADGRASIEVVNGEVVIAGWDRNEFRISGNVSDSAEGYTLTDSNREVRFEEKWPNRGNSNFWGCWFNSDCDNRGEQSKYLIQVPTGSVLVFNGVNSEVNVSDLNNVIEVETVNGPISVGNVHGSIELSTVNGSIEAMDITGRIQASSVNGSIDVLRASTERASFSTVNGYIDAEMTSSRIEFDAVNGNIEFEGGELRELDASTVNGDLELTFTLGDDADVDISTLNGDIDLELPTDSRASFRIETQGNIRNRMSDDQPGERSRYSRNRELVFTLGGGNSRVEISSHGGDINLEPR